MLDKGSNVWLKKVADWTNVLLFVRSSLSTLQKPPVTDALTPRVPEITLLPTCLLAWFEVDTKRWLSPQSESNRKDSLFSLGAVLRGVTGNSNLRPAQVSNQPCNSAAWRLFSGRVCTCSHMQVHTFTHRWTEARCRVEGFFTEVRAKAFEIRSCLWVTLVKKSQTGLKLSLSMFDNVWLPSKFNFLQSDFFDHCGHFQIH